VWEHAYYIDYKNLRASYLKKMWDIVDWDIVSSRY
ncbi:MAG: superoxide dismutase, partial [Muribaculaceae bacterium]|nr:superoxide dismutase [Muribaculaceae bacterium]